MSMLAHDDGDNDDRGNGSMRMRTAKTTEKTTAKSMATVMTATMTMGTTTNSDIKVDSDSDDSDNDDRDNDGKHDNGGYNDNDVGSFGGEGGSGSGWDQNAKKLSSLGHRYHCPSSLHP